MNITRRAMQCWECGREAPGGVCTGPHEGYDHEAAKRRAYVLPLDGVGVPVLVFPGATWDPQRYYRANRDVRLARNKQYRFEQRLARERRLARLIERLDESGQLTPEFALTVNVLGGALPGMDEEESGE